MCLETGMIHRGHDLLTFLRAIAMKTRCHHGVESQTRNCWSVLGFLTFHPCFGELADIAPIHRRGHIDLIIAGRIEINLLVDSWPGSDCVEPATLQRILCLLTPNDLNMIRQRTLEVLIN